LEIDFGKYFSEACDQERGRLYIGGGRSRNSGEESLEGDSYRAATPGGGGVYGRAPASLLWKATPSPLSGRSKGLPLYSVKP